MSGDRSNTVTVIAIAATAYALADMVHEALGHGLLSLLVPDVTAISISTVWLSGLPVGFASTPGFVVLAGWIERVESGPRRDRQSA